MQNKIEIQKNIGASPSGKAAGFGPAISEVRILPSQPIKRLSLEGLFFAKYFKVENAYYLINYRNGRELFFYFLQ